MDGTVKRSTNYLYARDNDLLDVEFKVFQRTLQHCLQTELRLYISEQVDWL